MSNKYIVMVLIVLLIPVYVVGVYSLPPTSTNTCEDKSGKAVAGKDKVGFCTEITVSVVRSYYFGLLRLPVQRMGINMDWAHRLFIPVLLGLAALVWWRFE